MTNSTIDNVKGLPLFQHFNESEISAKIDTFRKGEKNLFWFIKLAFLIGLGYLLWVYVLPPVFVAIGQVSAAIATGAMIVLVIVLLPTAFKALRAFTRFLHKSIIKHDPFAELERQRGLMIQNQKTFRASKGKIAALKTDMEIEAANSEKDAKTMQNKIVSTDAKAKKLKADMDAMVQKDGVAAKGSDEYVAATSELTKALSEGQRLGHQLQQSQDFVKKYGSRAAIMKKFGQKLMMVETSMDIKVLDFDATVEILKKDYEFAQKSKSATEAAKSAMMFSKGWELEYALDVVTSTIASDIAQTTGNLRDIDTLTATYAVDNDELYSNLDALANKIKVGADVVPSAKQYSNPEYKLTQEDALKSGGFNNLFE